MVVWQIVVIWCPCKRRELGLFLLCHFVQSPLPLIFSHAFSTSYGHLKKFVLKRGARTLAIEKKKIEFQIIKFLSSYLPIIFLSISLCQVWYFPGEKWRTGLYIRRYIRNTPTLWCIVLISSVDFHKRKVGKQPWSVSMSWMVCIVICKVCNKICLLLFK